MKRRSFLKRITATVVAVVAAPMIIREVIVKKLPAVEVPYIDMPVTHATDFESYCARPTPHRVLRLYLDGRREYIA